MKHGPRLAIRNIQQWSQRDWYTSRYVYDSNGNHVGHVAKGVFHGLRCPIMALYVPGGDYVKKFPQTTLADRRNMIDVIRRVKKLHGSEIIIYPRLP